MRPAASLGAWIAGRAAVAVLTLAALSAVVFFSTEVLPGDAAGVVSGGDATSAERAAVRHELGLDQPAIVRYLAWGTRLLHGDLGTSLVSGRPIAGILPSRLANTATTVLIAAALIAVAAVALGLTAGMQQGRAVDRVLSSITVFLVAVPDFLVATLLLVAFTAAIPVLPATALLPAGDAVWRHPAVLVLPVATLVTGGVGPAMRLLRAAVIGVVRTPYVEHARLNGIRGMRLALVHVLPNAAAPAVQALALITAGLLGGGIIVETLFDLPGVGLELARAVATRDAPMVQALGLVLGAGALGVLLLGDIAAALLRRRHGGEAVHG